MEQYLPASRAVYRPKRSTNGIVWAHRFIIDKIELYQDLEVYITGIDMSSAFDTISRQKLMNELNTFLDEDDCCIIRTLLSNTTINIQFEDCKGEEIETNIGSPHGDAISGTFFSKKHKWKNIMKNIMKETLAQYDLTVNEDKTEETIINWLKDKNDEEWRKRKN